MKKLFILFALLFVGLFASAQDCVLEVTRNGQSELLGVRDVKYMVKKGTQTVLVRFQKLEEIIVQTHIDSLINDGCDFAFKFIDAESGDTLAMSKSFVDRISPRLSGGAYIVGTNPRTVFRSSEPFGVILARANYCASCDGAGTSGVISQSFVQNDSVFVISFGDTTFTGANVGSDDQQITWDDVTRTLSLEDGGSVVLSDSLSVVRFGDSLRVTINNETQTVYLPDNVDDADADPFNEAWFISDGTSGAMVTNEMIYFLGDGPISTSFNIGTNELIISSTADPDTTNEIQQFNLTEPTSDEVQVGLTRTSSFFKLKEGTGIELTLADSTITIDAGAVVDTSYSSGDTLYLVIAGDTTSLIIPSTDNQDLSDGGKVGNNQTIDITDGSSVTFSVADNDNDAANELITLLSFVDDTLSITEAGVTRKVEIISGVDTDDQTVDTFSLSGNILTLALEDDNEPPYTVDLSSLSVDGSDQDSLVSGTISNDSLVLTLSSGQIVSIDLSSFLDNTDDQQVTEFELNGTTLEYTLENGGGQKTANLQSLIDDADADPANELQELNVTTPSASSKRIVISDVNSYVTFQEGDNIELSGADSTIIISASVSNIVDTTYTLGDSLFLVIAGDTSIVTISDSRVNIIADGVTGTDANSLTFNNADFDNSGTPTDPVISFNKTGNWTGTFDGQEGTYYLDNTDEQTIDSFQIISNTLYLSVENDGEAAKEVDLSPYLDDTRLRVENQDSEVVADADAIDFSNNFSTTNTGTEVNVQLSNTGVIPNTYGNATNVAQIVIDAKGRITSATNVAITDNDTQLTQEQVQDFVGTMFSGSETLITVLYDDNGNVVTFEVNDDLAQYDNSTSQFLQSEVDGDTLNEIQDLNLSGNTLSLTNDPNTGSFSLLPYLDNTDEQVLDTLELVGTTLRISISGDGVPFETVDLSSLQDGTGTDSQTLTWNSTTRTIGITNGNSHDLSEGIQDEIGTMVTGNTETRIQVSYDDAANELDFVVEDMYNSEFQVNGANLEITDGAGTLQVPLTSIQDGTGTDNQNLQNGSFNTGNGELTIGIENGNSDVIDLDGRYIQEEIDDNVTNEAWVVSDGTNSELVDSDSIFFEGAGNVTTSYNPTTNIMTISSSGGIDTSYVINDSVYIVSGEDVILTGVLPDQAGYAEVRGSNLITPGPLPIDSNYHIVEGMAAGDLRNFTFVNDKLIYTGDTAKFLVNASILFPEPNLGYASFWTQTGQSLDYNGIGISINSLEYDLTKWPSLFEDGITIIFEQQLPLYSIVTLNTNDTISLLHIRSYSFADSSSYIWNAQLVLTQIDNITSGSGGGGGGVPQTLSYSTGNQDLSISGGNTVDLSGLLDNTDEQDLSDGGKTGNNQTIDISGGGNSVTFSVADADSSITNEIQDVWDFVGVRDQKMLAKNKAPTGSFQGTTPDSPTDQILFYEDWLVDLYYKTISANSMEIAIGVDSNLLKTFITENVEAGTDSQTIDSLDLDGTDLVISLQNDGEVPLKLDLSPLQDGVGPTYTENEGIDIDGTEISLGHETREAADVAAIGDFNGGDATKVRYIGVNDASGGDYLSILDSENASGTFGNEYPFRIWSTSATNEVNPSTFYTGMEFAQSVDSGVDGDYSDDTEIMAARLRLSSTTNVSGGFGSGAFQILSEDAIHIIPTGSLELQNIPADAGNNNIKVLTLNGDVVEHRTASSLVGGTSDADSLVSAVVSNDSLVLELVSGELVSVDLAAFLDNTDNQTIDSLGLDGTELVISIERDGENPLKIDLSVLQDGTGTDNQGVDNFSLSGNVLTLEVENDGQAAHTATFTGWDTNAADDFSGSWTNLTDIPPGFDDDIDNVDDADTDPTNEIQQLDVTTPNSTTKRIAISGIDSYVTLQEGDNIEFSGSDSTITIGANISNIVDTTYTSGDSLYLVIAGDTSVVVISDSRVNITTDETTEDDNATSLTFDTDDFNNTGTPGNPVIEVNFPDDQNGMFSATNQGGTYAVDTVDLPGNLVFESSSSDSEEFIQINGEANGVSVERGFSASSTETGGGDGLLKMYSLAGTSQFGANGAIIEQSSTSASNSLIIRSTTGAVGISSEANSLLNIQHPSGTGRLQFGQYADINDAASTTTRGILGLDVGGRIEKFEAQGNGGKVLMSNNSYWELVDTSAFGDGIGTDNQGLFVSGTTAPAIQADNNANNVRFIEGEGLNFTGNETDDEITLEYNLVTLDGQMTENNIENQDRFLVFDNDGDVDTDKHTYMYAQDLKDYVADGIGTDDQTVDEFYLDSNNFLAISLENDGEDTVRVDLSPLVSSVDAENGLTKTSNTIKLGGVLTEATQIDLYNSTDVTSYPFTLNHDDGVNGDSLFYTDTGEFWIKANDKATDQRSYFTLGKDGANINMYRGPDNTYGNELYFNMQGRTIGLNNVNGDTTARLNIESELGAMTEVSIVGVGNVGVGSRVITDQNPEVIIRTRDVNDNNATEGALLQLQNTIGAGNGASEFTPYTFPTTAGTGGEILLTNNSGDLVFVDTTGLFGGGGSADGVATAGSLNTANERIEVTVANPGSNFNIDLSGIENMSSFTGWDTNAADDFDGDFGNLSNVPTGLSDGDDDKQNLTASEIQSQRLAITNDGTWIEFYDGEYIGFRFANGGGVEADSIFLTEDLTGLANDAVFSGWDTDAADDFSGAWGDLTGVPDLLTAIEIRGEISDSLSTASQGLTKVGSDIQLGGTLSQVADIALTDITQDYVLISSSDELSVAPGRQLRIKNSFVGDHSVLNYSEASVELLAESDESTDINRQNYLRIGTRVYDDATATGRYASYLIGDGNFEISGDTLVLEANEKVEVVGGAALRIIGGTTGNRPAGENGMLYWNTTTTTLQVYDGTAWRDLADQFTDGSTIDFTLTNGTLTAEIEEAEETVRDVTIDGTFSSSESVNLGGYGGGIFEFDVAAVTTSTVTLSNPVNGGTYAFRFHSGSSTCAVTFSGGTFTSLDDSSLDPVSIPAGEGKLITMYYNGTEYIVTNE
jgi:hypothetical protein